MDVLIQEGTKVMKKVMIMRSLKFLHSLCIISLFCLCWYLFYRSTGSKPSYVRYNPLMVGAYIVLHFCMYHIYQAYVVGYTKKSDLIYSQSLADMISIGIIWVLDMLAWMKWISPLYFLALVFVQFLVNLLWVLLANKIYFKLFKAKKTVLVYRNKRDLERISEAYRLPQMFNVTKTIENPSDYYEIEAALDDCEAIFVAGIPASLQNGIAKHVAECNLEGYFAPHVGDIIMMGANPIRQFCIPILNVRRAAPAPEFLFMKRVFDILLAGFGIVVLSPVMLGVAIGIKLCDGGPILYKQVRLTTNGKKFRIWKFRSMRVDAEKDGVARLSTGENDQRVTPIGKVIRAYRLDELPQLFNILGGSMTFVGPRPERPEISEQYEEVLPAFRLRLQVKAGLTGYAQIYGKYNTNAYDKLQMDLLYINRMSIFEDLRLIFATVAILFKRESTEGITEGQVTAVDKNEILINEAQVPEEDRAKG